MELQAIQYDLEKLRATLHYVLRIPLLKGSNNISGLNKNRVGDDHYALPVCRQLLFYTVYYNI